MAVQQSEEARRYVLERADAGDLHIAQAAEILGISERHAWRAPRRPPRARSGRAGAERLDHPPHPGADRYREPAPPPAACTPCPA
jgi:hypothetical protein